MNLADGYGGSIALSRSTIYRVAERFRTDGEPDLIDRREDNGDSKLDEAFLSQLYTVVHGSRLDYQRGCPTWTREMLMITMSRLTNTKTHVETMSGAQQLIGARLGRPKPTVGCPWSKSAKTRRLNVIRNLVDTLPDDEVAVYEDEIDIHLNPKIGPDWMNRGQQKEGKTPGKNQKQYLAGAINATTGQLTWVESDSKNTYLFLIMLWKLTQEYRDAKVIHVILDNYCIHSTKQVEISLATEEGQRLHLVFLPPYCPDHNRIERLWRDLHADVTRNHCYPGMKSLMRRVRNWLHRKTKQNNAVYLAI